MALIVMAYTQADRGVGVPVASAMFGAAAIYGHVTKRSLARMEQLAVHGPDRAAGRDGDQPVPAQRRGVVRDLDHRRLIFTGLTAWDVQRIQNEQP